jgi:hypothetical protein
VRASGRSGAPQCSGSGRAQGARPGAQGGRCLAAVAADEESIAENRLLARLAPSSALSPSCLPRWDSTV